MARSTIARRRFMLFAGSAILVQLLVPAQVVNAAFFRPRMEAKDVGSRVRVRIWISASVGPVQLNDHFLGTFYVPDGQSLEQQINVGVATFRLVLKAKNQVIEAVIKMQGAMFATQQKVVKAAISG